MPIPSRAPLVSVVVSHYDRRAWLPEALDSIAAQTFRDFEIVVVGDAGPDASALVAGWADGRVFPVRHVRREVNGGVAATRNSGVRAARGAYVAYLDDDDLWRPDHLEGLIGALAEHPECALAYGDAEVVRVAPPAGNPAAAPRDWTVEGRRTLAVPFDLDDLMQDDFIVPGAMLHRHALYEDVGPFDEELFVSDDWDWLLRAARVTSFVRCPRTVVTVRLQEGGGANLSADRGARRRAALDAIERRHRTPHLEPKTFWEVAETYARRGGSAPRT